MRDGKDGRKQCGAAEAEPVEMQINKSYGKRSRGTCDTRAHFGSSECSNEKQKLNNLLL